jgi:hypothetical protein
MNLNRIIFPEIILGRRGNPEVIKTYKTFMKQIFKRWDESAGREKWLIPAVKDPFTGRPDENLANHHLLSKVFKEKNGKTYYLNKDFAVALSKIDREIPVDILPRNFIGYIQFADGALCDDTGEVDGALVWISTLGEIGYGSEPGYTSEDLAISISYGNRSIDPETGPPTVCKFASVLRKLSTMEDLYDLTEHKDESYLSNPSALSLIKGPKNLGGSVKDLRLPVLRAILNAVIYVHSADPELEKLAPLKDFTNTKRAELKKKHSVHNNLTVPVTLLHWNYHSETIYSMDQTIVSAHLRWQRCGVGLSQVKLILIKEHARKFKNTVSSLGLTTQQSIMEEAAV